MALRNVTKKSQKAISEQDVDLIKLAKSPEHAGYYFHDVTQLLSTFSTHFSYFSTGLKPNEVVREHK